MSMTLSEQVRLVREVIENEHGPSLYDGTQYIPIDWDAIMARFDPQSIPYMDYLAENT